MEQDRRRAISSRRFVAPSFNDIRVIPRPPYLKYLRGPNRDQLILNTAQIMSLATLDGPTKLITFDGDVTLYDDGQCLTPTNPVIEKILWLLRRGLCIGIVTAAGYTDGARYKERLYGLLESIRDAEDLTDVQKRNLIVLGGESSYMFRCSPSHVDLLEGVPREDWQLHEMQAWSDADVRNLLDIAENSLRDSVKAMRLDALVIRKERAVGIIHSKGGKFAREQLEEAVLGVQKILELSDVGRRLPFCAFNGGNDVFVDIGDKRLGVLCCQRFFGDVTGGQTLHIGGKYPVFHGHRARAGADLRADQFLSAGHNDFKARMAGTTV
jgi:IMP and pyridine-specific 5'-nucleotidase